MRIIMNAIFSLLALSTILGLDVNWSGNVGGFIVQSKLGDKSDNYSVQSAEIGVSLLPGERSETSVKLLFFDLLPGSVYYNEVTPFLSEAYVSFPLYSGSPLSLKLGRQRFTYGDGLLLFDYWIGEDAVKVSFTCKSFELEGFYIRVLENFVSGYRFRTDSIERDRDIAGIFGEYDGEAVTLQGMVLKGKGYDSEPTWFETRGVYGKGKLRIKADGAILIREEDQQFAFALNAQRSFNTITLGIGYYHFSENWFNPLGYAYVHDEFYNGWGAGFGEVIPWAILPWSPKGYDISDLALDPGAIFWVNPHNISVLNINLSKNFGRRLTLRIDSFLHRVVQSPKKRLGRELTLNLYYLAPGNIDFGLSLGLFKPGDFFEEEFDSGVIKVWFLKNFSF
jgi:hypothetical protein